MVEPVYPFEGFVLDGLELSPRPLPLDDLRFEQSDHAFGEYVKVRVANSADRRLDTSFVHKLGVADADILRSAAE